ncbi:MAG: hypothetical protein AB7H86_21265 [Blastocatellales bacterium]
MSEDQLKLARAYRRAGIGLAVAALLWIVAVLFGGVSEGPAIWLIPIVAAALSVIFLANWRKTGN